eukprot:6193767-Pleurochrysis_carterae.AAC.1
MCAAPCSGQVACARVSVGRVRGCQRRARGGVRRPQRALRRSTRIEHSEEARANVHGCAQMCTRERE